MCANVRTLTVLDDSDTDRPPHIILPHCVYCHLLSAAFSITGVKTWQKRLQYSTLPTRYQIMVQSTYIARKNRAILCLHFAVDQRLCLFNHKRRCRVTQPKVTGSKSAQGLGGCFIFPTIFWRKNCQLFNQGVPECVELLSLSGTDSQVTTTVVLLLLLLLLLQFSFHSVAVVLTLVQTKQIIYINETIQKHNKTIRNTVYTSTRITKTPSYNKTNTYTHPHFIKSTHTHTHIL